MQKEAESFVSNGTDDGIGIEEYIYVDYVVGTEIPILFTQIGLDGNNKLKCQARIEVLQLQGFLDGPILDVDSGIKPMLILYMDGEKPTYNFKGVADSAMSFLDPGIESPGNWNVCYTPNSVQNCQYDLRSNKCTLKLLWNVGGTITCPHNIKIQLKLKLLIKRIT